MSKIGRKPIDISGLTVELKGKEVHFKGAKGTGVYIIPDVLMVKTADNKLILAPAEEKKSRDLNRVWGLHRALLANALKGAKEEFEKKIEIVGLGYKAAKSGDKLVFTLGFSHKIDFPLPKNIVVDIDKTGQKLSLRSSDKALLGQVASDICLLRAPEPYKGSGIKLSTQEIRRKAGKKAK